MALMPWKIRLRDPLVAARHQPSARLVPAAQMKTEGDLGDGVHQGVVELDAAHKPLIDRPPLALVESPHLRIDEQRIVRRVELDVSAAEAGELLDLPPKDFRDRLQEVRQGRVGRA